MSNHPYQPAQQPYQQAIQHQGQQHQRVQAHQNQMYQPAQQPAQGYPQQQPYQGHQHANQQPQQRMSLGQRLAHVDPMMTYLPRPPLGRHLLEITGMSLRTNIDQYNGNRSDIYTVSLIVVESDSVAPGTQFEIPYFPPGDYEYELKKMQAFFANGLGLDLETQWQEADAAWGEAQPYVGRRMVVTGTHAYYRKGEKKGQQRIRANGEPVISYIYAPESDWRQLQLPGTGQQTPTQTPAPQQMQQVPGAPPMPAQASPSGTYVPLK